MKGQVRDRIQTFLPTTHLAAMVTAMLAIDAANAPAEDTETTSLLLHVHTYYITKVIGTAVTTTTIAITNKLANGKEKLKTSVPPLRHDFTIPLVPCQAILRNTNTHFPSLADEHNPLTVVLWYRMKCIHPSTYMYIYVYACRCIEEHGTRYVWACTFALAYVWVCLWVGPRLCGNVQQLYLLPN